MYSSRAWANGLIFRVGEGIGDRVRPHQVTDGSGHSFSELARGPAAFAGVTGQRAACAPVCELIQPSGQHRAGTGGRPEQQSQYRSDRLHIRSMARGAGGRSGGQWTSRPEAARGA